MPISIPVPDKSAGDVLTETNWDSHIRDNINKLLDRGHRVLTVAQFAALTGLEDGDEVYLEVDAANGIMWHLRYVAAETTYKWRFLGGPPMYSTVGTGESTASTNLVDLTTDGPSITLPRGGDYGFKYGTQGSLNTGAAAVIAALIVNAVEVDRVVELVGSPGVADGSTAHTTFRHNGAVASHVAKLRYAVTQQTGTFFRRRIEVIPVRVRHDG